MVELATKTQKRASTMGENTEKTAHMARHLFTELKAAKPAAPVMTLINEVVEMMATKTPAGNWVYVAGALAKPLARTSIIPYLHGFISTGKGRRVIGEDLVGDLRPKTYNVLAKAATAPAGRAVDLRPVLDKLDRIEGLLGEDSDIRHNLKRLLEACDLEWEEV